MKIKLINRICTVAIAILMCFFLVFCPFVFTSFCAYASSVLGNDFFWDILQSTYDFQQTANYMNDFITVPSDEFNNALKNLVDKNYPFGGTPHLQNSYGSIPITLTSTPVAYLPFFYESTQSSNNISLANLAICVTSDKCAKLNLTSNGFSSSGITGTLPSYPAYAIYGSSSNVSLATFNTSNDALFGTHLQKIPVQIPIYSSFSFFGVFECPCDDVSIFVPPVSSLPSGADVYIPKGALTMSELSYKIGDDFYDIEGTPVDNPVDDPADDTGNTSGSLSGNITVGGKVDVNISVPDININVNTGSSSESDSSGYEMPDTEFFNGYLDDALDESSGIRRFIADFFGTLPGQITTLICIGLVISILLRIISR